MYVFEHVCITWTLCGLDKHPNKFKQMIQKNHLKPQINMKEISNCSSASNHDEGIADPHSQGCVQRKDDGFWFVDVFTLLVTERDIILKTLSKNPSGHSDSKLLKRFIAILSLFFSLRKYVGQQGSDFKGRFVKCQRFCQHLNRANSL